MGDVDALREAVVVSGEARRTTAVSIPQSEGAVAVENDSVFSKLVARSHGSCGAGDRRAGGGSVAVVVRAGVYVAFVQSMSRGLCREERRLGWRDADDRRGRGGGLSTCASGLPPISNPLPC